MGNVIHEKKYNNELNLAFVEFTKDIGSNAYYNKHPQINVSGGIFIQVDFSFPDQNLLDHSIYLQLENIDMFLDEDELKRESINEKNYDRFECCFCMDGPERTLYTHEGTGALHMHKSCYDDLCEHLVDFLEDGREKIAAFQI